jgi:hypothetical protein
MINDLELSFKPIALNKLSILGAKFGDPPNDTIDDSVLLLSLPSLLLMTA